MSVSKAYVMTIMDKWDIPDFLLPGHDVAFFISIGINMIEVIAIRAFSQDVLPDAPG